MIEMFIHRPYVFGFLIAFLVLSKIYWGWKRTFLWLIIGYVIALASEASSIRNGFPYGLYFYRYENMPGEPMVFGVPFWDSLSYTFMIFAGYTTSRFILGASLRGATPRSNPPNTVESGGLLPLRLAQGRNDIVIAVFGAFLTMLLDIIIDPLTVRGDRWFLGDIYYYPNGGEYFGVPFTNFFGWFLVPLIVILVFGLIERYLPKIETASGKILMLYPLFYLSIALFNVAITIYINEPLVVAIDSVLLIPIILLIKRRIKKMSHTQTLQ